MISHNSPSSTNKPNSPFTTTDPTINSLLINTTRKTKQIRICHHCGRSPAKFQCKSPECKYSFCKKCLRSIYRYSNISLKKVLKSKVWGCPVCHRKCECGKCPPPIKGVFHNSNPKQSNLKLSSFDRLKIEKLPTKRPFESENVGFDSIKSKEPANHEEMKNEQSNSMTPQKNIQVSECLSNKRNPEYGEILDPHTFDFIRPIPNVAAGRPCTLPYFTPIIIYSCQAQPMTFLNNLGQIQYGEYQNIVTMRNTVNLNPITRQFNGF